MPPNFSPIFQTWNSFRNIQIPSKIQFLDFIFVACFCNNWQGLLMCGRYHVIAAQLPCFRLVFWDLPTQAWHSSEVSAAKMYFLWSIIPSSTSCGLTWMTKECHPSSCVPKCVSSTLQSFKGITPVGSDSFCTHAWFFLENLGWKEISFLTEN